jgi:type I restriction enzyme S subunit
VTPEVHNRHLKRSQIRPGDILMTITGRLGTAAVVPPEIKDANINQHICLIRLKDKVADPHYVMFHLNSEETHKEIMRKQHGATRIALNHRTVGSLKVNLPSIDTQRNIASILQRAHRLTGTREQANHLTNKIIQSVFLKMFGDPATNMMGWTVKKLNEVCRKITDGTHVTPKYVDTGVPFLSVKDVRNGYLDFSDTKFISEEQHRELTKRSKPEFGDILYTKVGTVGIAALVDTEKEFSIFVSVALLKPDRALVDSKFLWAMLNSQYVKSQAYRRVKGIGVPDLHLVEIKDFDIILPPIETQKRFAEALIRIETLKLHQQESTQEIDELFHSLMHKAFRGELVS